MPMWLCDSERSLRDIRALVHQCTRVLGGRTSLVFQELI